MQFLEQNQTWMEVPWGELSFGANSQLGAGAQGTVRKGRHKGTEYAVKIFKPDELRDFKEEVRVLEHLRHPNIVAFYGAVTRDSEHHAIIQELCTGSVYDYLQKFGSAVNSTTGVLELPLAQRIKWAHDAAKGMIFLHSRKVRRSRHLASTHRVLRPSWPAVLRTGHPLRSQVVEPARGQRLEPAEDRQDLRLLHVPHHHQVGSAGRRRQRRQPACAYPPRCDRLRHARLHQSRGDDGGAPPPVCACACAEAHVCIGLQEGVTPKADVYSFAMILWELLTSSTPFQDVLPCPPPLCPPLIGSD